MAKNLGFSGFTRVPLLILENTELSSVEKITLISLLSFIIGPKNECWPSLSRIAGRASISKRSVIRALDRLEEKKIIRRTRRRGAGNVGPLSTLYRIDSDYLSHPSDTMSPQVVSPCHLGSDAVSPELENRKRALSFASKGKKGETEKQLLDKILEIEKILKVECDYRGISWDCGRERKSIEKLISLKKDQVALLAIARQFIHLTKAPNGFLSGKQPTASMLKSCLAIVEASMSQLSIAPRPLLRARQSFICPRCGAQILKGDILCPECGVFVEELEGAAV